MNTGLYPLKFHPILKEKVWGGDKMAVCLHKELKNIRHCGESWEISGLIGDESAVANGFLAENNLNELIEVYLTELVGEKIYEKYGLGFPLLIKFIDAQDNLSVQVHPDDELAKRKYGQNGKTEMWHVLQADPGAGLFVGFRENVTPELYGNALASGAIAELLRFFPVAPGDTFLIPAGTVHAIGKGVLLTEIQQPSDITFRIYDWNRTDSNGNRRELHTEEALEAIHFEEDAGDFKTSYSILHGKTSPLLRTPFFNANIMEFDGRMQKDYHDFDSFVVYICVEGRCSLAWADGTETLEKGEVTLKPAATGELLFTPDPSARLLEIYCS